eukprot:Skav224440  [mRNA]  locus=scaffold3233:182900:189695:+ [translate_table: standard]
MLSTQLISTGWSRIQEYVDLLKCPKEEPAPDAADADLWLEIYAAPDAEEAGDGQMDDEEYKCLGKKCLVEPGGNHQRVLPSILSLTPAKLDFGDITAGQRHVLPPLVIANLTPDDPQELHVEALPENQCFAVLNAPRTVGDRSFQFMIEFKPQLVQIYQCSLSLRTDKTRVQVPLRGKGVCPILKIEPEDGVIHMGSVVYSKEAKDTFRDAQREA